MWTKEVTRREINDGVITVTFRFTDSVTGDVIERAHRLSNTPVPEWIEKTATAEVAKLEAMYSTIGDISTGNIGDPTAETAEEKAFQVFSRKLGKLNRLQYAISLSPTLQGDAAIQRLIADVEVGIQTFFSGI